MAQESMGMGSDHFDFHSKLGHLRSQGISAEFCEPCCRVVRFKMHVKRLYMEHAILPLLIASLDVRFKVLLIKAYWMLNLEP